MEPCTSLFRTLCGNLLAIEKRCADHEGDEFDPHELTLQEAFDTAFGKKHSMMPPKDDEFLATALDVRRSELKQLRTEVEGLVDKLGYGTPLTDFVPENAWELYIDGWKDLEEEE